MPVFLVSSTPVVWCLSGAEVAEQMRYRVFNETQLTCSVGLGPNTMLAKVASDINKPNGQYVLPDDPTALKEFVQSLSLRKVPGIGKVCNPLIDYRSHITCILLHTFNACQVASLLSTACHSLLNWVAASVCRCN